MKKLASWILAASLSGAAYSQSRSPSQAVVYEGARLIIGDGSTSIEGGAFVVQNGHFTAIGRRGAVTVPTGAVRWI